MQLPPIVEQSTGLTSWKNEPSLMILKQDLDIAKPMHDALALKIDHWNDLNKVEGKAKPPQIPGRSSVQPKLIRRQAEWRYSALTEPFLSSDKMFNVKPATHEDTTAAKQNQLILNYQFENKINRVKFFDDYIRCTVDEGSSVLRVGWTRTTVTVKEEVPVFEHYALTSEEEVQAFQQALEARSQDPRTFEEQAPPELKAALDYYDESGTPTTAKQKGTKTVDVEKIIENKPTLDVLNPKNVYVDPTCQGDMDKANFAVISFETSQAELKKEPKRYKRLNEVNWESATPLTENEHVSTNNEWNNNFRDTLRKKVIAYEYWGFYDIHGNGKLVPVVITWIGNTIIRMEENPFPDGKIPLIVVPYLPLKRELFGEPDAELLEDNQKTLGAVTRGMIDLLGRSANGQQGFAKGMLDPLNRRRFERGQDYEFNPNQNPNQGLIEHKYPEIPSSAITLYQMQNQEGEALTGVKSFAGGISGQSYGDVAAGIRGALDASSKREMGILRRLASGIVKVGIKFNAMNAVWLSKKETIRITNTEFVTINKEDLKGNFDLKVDIATAEVDDQKSKDLGFMLQTLGPNMDTEITMMILAEIAELKRMPALAHKLANYRPQPDPIAEQMKQEELKKMILENQKTESEIRLNDAKAQQALAQKDKTNLDYVEQETGTAHEREMDRQRAQSQGNQNLAVTKALTTPKKEGEKAPDIDAAIGFNQISDKLADSANAVNTEEELNAPANLVDSSFQRDELAEQDPRYSIGSRFYDPAADPALNPNLNI